MSPSLFGITLSDSYTGVLTLGVSVSSAAACSIDGERLCLWWDLVLAVPHKNSG